MTLSEKNIIYSINHKKPSGGIYYHDDAFFYKTGLIKQNFAILKDNHLFLRLDLNGYRISKKVFKNIEHIDDSYTICLGDSLISDMAIGRYTRRDFLHKTLPNLLHLYTKNMVKLFHIKEINFKDLSFNSIDYFDCFDEFAELVLQDRTRKGEIKLIDHARSRYDYTSMLYGQKGTIGLSEFEEEEFDPEQWENHIKTRIRENEINELLS